MESLLTFFEDWPRALAGFGVLVVAAVAARWIAVRVLTGAAHKVAARTRSTWDDRLIERNVLARVARVVPALVVYVGIGPALGFTGAQLEAAAAESGQGGAFAFWIWTVVRTAAAAYVVLVLSRAFSAALDAVNDIYNDTYADAKSAPIKGYLQVAEPAGLPSNSDRRRVDGGGSLGPSSSCRASARWPQC